MSRHFKIEVLGMVTDFLKTYETFNQ